MSLLIEKYAAIDIGSNAIRLLISNVFKNSNGDPQFKKCSLVRVPIRLGADTFVHGKISEEKKLLIIDTLKAFRLLMKVHNVISFKACATSAIRDACNGAQIVTDVFNESGIYIEIIDGQTEAAIVFSTDLQEITKSHKSYLYINVGGGSTEFTVFSKGTIISSKSFQLGTVRALEGEKEMVTILENIEDWIKKNTKNIRKINIVGSGGNINKIFKMSGKTAKKPLSYLYMSGQYKFLKEMSYDNRISELSLNPDRADVIIPATKIYLSAMKWSGAKKIYVPKIGLVDGIIRTLYYNKL